MEEEAVDGVLVEGSGGRALPIHVHRPPPLVLPKFHHGVITAPLPSSPPQSETVTMAPASPSASPPAATTPSWAGDGLELNESLQSLLQSSMLSLERSSSQGHQNFLAATAALFAPSIFQSLASPPPSAPPSFTRSSSASSACSPSSPLPRPVSAVHRNSVRRSAFVFPSPSAALSEVATVEGEAQGWNPAGLDQAIACAV